jgi:hypothetical protein
MKPAQAAVKPAVEDPPVAIFAPVIPLLKITGDSGSMIEEAMGWKGWEVDCRTPEKKLKE